MKKILSAIIIILLFAMSLCLTGCKGRPKTDDKAGAKSIVSTAPKVTVKANPKVVALLKTWEPGINFYTSRTNPLTTIEGLKQNQIACFGPDYSGKIQAFYEAAGTHREYGNAVQVIGPTNLSFSADNSPRLYLTATGNEPKLRDAARVEFSE